MQKSPPPVDLKPYFLVLDDVVAEHGGRLEWKEFFGNDNPVEIDVGCGRGLFLVNAGQMHPEINFLGVELDYREGRRGAKRLQKRKLENVRVLGGDVNVVFSKMIAPASVQAIHVYFPDPWWKRKHRRRRVFTDRFGDFKPREHNLMAVPCSSASCRRERRCTSLAESWARLRLEQNTASNFMSLVCSVSSLDCFTPSSDNSTSF
jgi:hypothetical protein